MAEIPISVTSRQTCSKRRFQGTTIETWDRRRADSFRMADDSGVGPFEDKPCNSHFCSCLWRCAGRNIRAGRRPQLASPLFSTSEGRTSMHTRVLKLCVAVALTFVTAAALAESPFAGTWKVDYSKSKLTGGTIAFADTSRRVKSAIGD